MHHSPIASLQSWPAPPPYPGGVGFTHLRVYDTRTPDGLYGGSPHVHLTCTEAYIPLGGQGAVQILNAAGYREIPLTTGRIVWFTPGTIHRLINFDGQLELLIAMQNAGLPEAGDATLTFPQASLEDADAYFRHAALSADGRVYARSEDAAVARRDLAVEGFNQLRQRFEAEGRVALDAFYSAALRLVQASLARWRTVWQHGPLADTQRTGQQLDALDQGQYNHLWDAGVYINTMSQPERKLGMCGTLGLYLPEGQIQ